MTFLLLAFNSLRSESTSSLIFFSKSEALALISLGSDRQAIGVFTSVQKVDLHNWIIRSGPMPDGSPGE
jgi:hypothetical protein